MADDNLRLNAISRYSKQSSQYVLEVHSHCEVPAGCGGLVLRWRNPHLAIPLEIWTYTVGEAQVLLDGIALASARPLVPYGEHVLAWVITGFEPAAPLLACTATYDESWPGSVRVTPPTRQSVSIVSAPDGSWRYTATPPPRTWTQSDFDDSAWRPMVARPVGDEERRQQYRLDRVCKRGAQPLGVEGAAHTLWIRRRFSLASGMSETWEADDA